MLVTLTYMELIEKLRSVPNPENKLLDILELQYNYKLNWKADGKPNATLRANKQKLVAMYNTYLESL